MSSPRPKKPFIRPVLTDNRTKLWVFRPDLAIPVPTAPLPDQATAAAAPAASTTIVDGVVVDGPALWAELHTRAIEQIDAKSDAAWLTAFPNKLPCGTCRQHWLDLVAAHPPKFGFDYFAWTVEVHNAINRQLGKPEMSYAAALERWA